MIANFRQYHCNMEKGAFMINATALLIIDVQTGLTDDPKEPAYRADRMLSNLSRLIGAARVVDVPVIYVRHQSTALPEGSAEWQIHPRLAPEPGDLIIEKHFPDAFMQTNLQAELEARGIHSLIVGGMQSEYCVDTTVRRAFSLGYEVVLVKDGHSTADNPVLKASQIVDHTNIVLGGTFASLKGTDAVLNILL
jgi:nicotinamidase-related amidase